MPRKAKREVVTEETFPRPTEKDFEVIRYPMITEKTMDLMQNQNKITIIVDPHSEKTEIKLAFERVFQVKVTGVKIINVDPKKSTRGTRYTGTIPGYKKAIVTIAEGEAIDLFKE